MDSGEGFRGKRRGVSGFIVDKALRRVDTRREGNHGAIFCGGGVWRERKEDMKKEGATRGCGSARWGPLCRRQCAASEGAGDRCLGISALEQVVGLLARPTVGAGPQEREREVG